MADPYNALYSGIQSAGESIGAGFRQRGKNKLTLMEIVNSQESNQLKRDKYWSDMKEAQEEADRKKQQLDINKQAEQRQQQAAQQQQKLQQEQIEEQQLENAEKRRVFDAAQDRDKSTLSVENISSSLVRAGMPENAVTFESAINEVRDQYNDERKAKPAAGKRKFTLNEIAKAVVKGYRQPNTWGPDPPPFETFPPTQTPVSTPAAPVAGAPAPPTVPTPPAPAQQPGMKRQVNQRTGEVRWVPIQ